MTLPLTPAATAELAGPAASQRTGLPCSASPKLKARAGFTLVELLAVIALILVLVGISANVAQNLDRGQGVDNATAVIAGQLTAARELAISRGTDTRLLIANKTGGSAADRDRYRAFVFIIYQDRVDPTAETSTYQWKVSGNGVALPRGVRVTDDSAGRELFSAENQSKGDSVVPAGKIFTSYGPNDWISYGFDPSGTPINQPVGDRLDIIVRGAVGLDAGGAISVRKKNQNQVGGVALTRYGTTIVYNGPAHTAAVTGIDISTN